ncbi:protein [Escherichia coli]|uniref:Protein n=1 Tax=Escherichia coli TaxID=562 RepID=A0A376S9T5_ECOLX|nr:protein [Escherichia coli]
MARDAGEISELAQNRLAISVGYCANACGGDAVTTGAAGAQHDQLYQLSSSGVTKVSALPDTLTTPLGSCGNCMLRLAGGYPSTGAAYRCRGNSPEEVYCCQAGESITAIPRWYFLWLYLRRSGCILAQIVGQYGNSVRHLRVSVSYYAEARNLGNG